MGAGRLVFAALNFDSAGTEHSGERTYPFQSAAMKAQDRGDAQLEWSPGLQPIVDLLDDLVELPEAVLCFLASSFIRVGDELDFESLAMTLVVRRVWRYQAFFSFSAS
jgi:hypothetical protein